MYRIEFSEVYDLGEKSYYEMRFTDKYKGRDFLVCKFGFSVHLDPFHRDEKYNNKYWYNGRSTDSYNPYVLTVLRNDNGYIHPYDQKLWEQRQAELMVIYDRVLEEKLKGYEPEPQKPLTRIEILPKAQTRELTTKFYVSQKKEKPGLPLDLSNIEIK